ncbi:MAG: LysR family transcriptional regulator [Pseudobdellovibrio sp.]
MNLHHLQYYVDAVELGSISASAHKNLVSHPAVSRAISSIENHLGLNLLIHKKKIFEVTPIGYQIAKQAQVLLLAANSFGKERLANDIVAGHVSLGLTRSLGNRYLIPIMISLAKKYPKIKVSIVFGTTGELIEKVSNDSLDLALTIGLQPMPTLKQDQLCRGKFVLIQSNAKKNIKLESDSFILTEPKYETELLKKEYHKSFKTKLNISIEVASWDMITRLVANGLGVGLVPEISIPSEIKNQLKIIKTDWFNYEYNIYLNQKKNLKLNTVVNSVREIVENEF